MEDLSDISQVALEVLAIARELITKSPLNIDALFREAQKKLTYMYSDQEINNTIYELLLKKIIIPDKKIVKTQVLANKKRDSIYKYIFNHPGAHLREIRDKLKLQPHLTNLHLKVLENFNYIYRKKHLKYRVYFPTDFDQADEDILLALKNEKAEDLFLYLYEQREVPYNQLKDHFSKEISPKMIGYHMEPLLSSGLLSILQQDGQEILKLNEDKVEKIDKYIQRKIEERLRPEEAEVLPGKLLVKRAYDYVGGNVRFKVVVENATKEVLKDISVQLDVKEQYQAENTLGTITVLEPEESRGVDFTLVPLACGKSNVKGVVSYIDTQGQNFSTEINPVLVQIKCPLVTPRIFKLLEVLKMKDRFQVSHAETPFTGVTQLNAFKIARDQVASMDMSEVGEAEATSALFSGEAKVTGNPLLVDLDVDPAKINIDVYMGDVRQATGFLAYIKNLINVSLTYSEQISTSVERIRDLIFNGFEFSSRLTELFAFCNDMESIDYVLILLKELKMKSQSYFADLKLTESINEWFNSLEQFQGKEIFARTFINLQYDILNWMESVITFAETNAKIYYESAIDKYTQDEVSGGIFKLKHELHLLAVEYFKKILYSLMVIHSNTGLTLFTHNFVTETIDSDLLSGFLTAIQGFGMEVTKQETKMKRLSYEHFEIELTDGEMTVAALITSGLPNDLTSERLKNLVQHFETHFKPALESFAGNVSQFNTTEQLIQEIFLK